MPSHTFDPSEHQVRLFKRFPASSDFESSMVARDWYDTINLQCAHGFQRAGIKDLWLQQKGLIDILTKKSVRIIENKLLDRGQRLAAVTMAACAYTADYKMEHPSMPISEGERNEGIFARPSMLIIVPDNNIDPCFFKDGYTIAWDTGIKLATPDLIIGGPGYDCLFLSNADIVFITLERLKERIGTKAIVVSDVNRIIVDEPLYLSPQNLKDLEMILRHPQMKVGVETTFIGSAFAANTHQNIEKLLADEAPHVNGNTKGKRAVAADDWFKYSAKFFRSFR